MRVLLINPNASATTTDRMASLARAAAPPGVEVIGITAPRGPPMITTVAQLAAAAPRVLAMGLSETAAAADGIIVAAFGDPGLAALRERVAKPVVGIAEAAMRDAASGGRRFGVVTTTPLLAACIGARAAALGLGPLYAGTRLTPGDPHVLVADPVRLVDALADAVELSIGTDGAEAVVIGGGPLGDAAATLAPRFATPIVAPLPAAMRRLLAALANR